MDLLSGVAEKVAEDVPNMEEEQKDLLEKALDLQLKILQDEPSGSSGRNWRRPTTRWAASGRRWATFRGRSGKYRGGRGV